LHVSHLVVIAMNRESVWSTMGAGKPNTPNTPLCLHPSYHLLGQCPLFWPCRQKELARSVIQTMNSNAQRINVSLFSLLVLFITAEMLLSMISLSAESPISAPCSAPEYHQLDFWLGDWDSFDFATSTKDARIRVELILDGCVIHEDYQSTDGHKGESFSIYDASRKIWHQSWVTNRGQLLIIEGKLEDGAMVLAGVDRTSCSRYLETGGRRRARICIHLNRWRQDLETMVRSHVPPAQIDSSVVHRALCHSKVCEEVRL
jgi:hypothetical protein